MKYHYVEGTSSKEKAKIRRNCRALKKQLDREIIADYQAQLDSFGVEGSSAIHSLSTLVRLESKGFTEYDGTSIDSYIQNGHDTIMETIPEDRWGDAVYLAEYIANHFPNGEIVWNDTEAKLTKR